MPNMIIIVRNNISVYTGFTNFVLQLGLERWKGKYLDLACCLKTSKNKLMTANATCLLCLLPMNLPIHHILFVR